MIATQNLALQYAAADRLVAVLSGVSLELADGEFVALMGPNGSGKTSLARCLNGIIPPSQGAVMVDGLDTRDVKHMLEIRRAVGLVFQHPDNQMVAPTVEREIAFGLENLGVPRPEMRRRVEEMLLRFDLLPYRQHAPHQLSGGEKQRVALASILAMQPRHIIFDEPTSLLDHPSRVRLFETISELRANTSSASAPAILLITQFAEEALFAERLLVLHEGRLIMQGAPHELFQNAEAFQQIGLQPPLEFRVHRQLLANGQASVSLQDLLLDPILQ
ncbi:ATP-binding cassette domain-containing protein [candidate division KSB1 bacterium]|nr:ATP-binding cassette domain-containing protein [candidate division KSB1 bacterium]